MNDTTLKQLISVSNTKIDSLTILIDCNNILYEKRDKIITINEQTGEVIKEHIKPFEYVSLDGVLYLAKFVEIFGKSYLLFIINSKMLPNYANGIKYLSDLFFILKQYENLFNIYIIDKMDETYFIFNDVDICIDFNGIYKEALTELLKNKKKSLKHARLFHTKNEYDKIRELTGFQVNNRNDSSSNDFFKFYRKDVEIENRLLKDDKFFNQNEFLKNHFKNVWRLEITIRNKYSKELYNVNNFSDLFNDDLRRLIFEKLLTKNHFFEKENDITNVKKSINRKIIQLNTYIIISMFIDLMSQGLSFYDVWTQLSVEHYNETSVSRKKSEIRKILLTEFKRNNVKIQSLKKDFWLY